MTGHFLHQQRIALPCHGVSLRCYTNDYVLLALPRQAAVGTRKS